MAGAEWPWRLSAPAGQARLDPAVQVFGHARPVVAEGQLGVGLVSAGVARDGKAVVASEYEGTQG